VFLVALMAVNLSLSSSEPAAAAERPILRSGVSYGDTLVWMSDARLGAALDDAVATGAKWVRADLSWQNIQYDGPTVYRWSLFDRVLDAASRRGLKVLPVLAYTPPWARKRYCGVPTCAPADPQQFARFAREAVKRYNARGIDVWEIWNEPNINFWMPSPDPAGYTKLLAAASAAIRSINPRAQVILGGLAATDSENGRISQSSFLTAVLRLGAGKMVDGVGYHPYTYPYLPSARTEFLTAWEKMTRGPENLRAIMTRFGVGALPIWLTEVGAPTGGSGTASNGDVGSITYRTTHVTEGRQAEIAADAVRTAAGDPLVGAMFWYSDRDLGNSGTTNENFFGLRRADGSAKPAFQAFRQANESLVQP
jgi:hypothetical protein